MPVQIGRPPDHNVTPPLGVLSDCHRRIEYFPGVLISVTGRTPGGLLIQAQRVELEPAFNLSCDRRRSRPRMKTLFPAAARLLSATQIADIGNEVAARRAVCSDSRHEPVGAIDS